MSEGKDGSIGDTAKASSETTHELQLILISGLSGGGKTVALHALEDLDFYCVDNLPASLLPGFLDNILNHQQRYDRVAVGIDARNRDAHLETLPAALAQARQRGLSVQVIFLTADDSVLIQRFSETRRRHPLTTEGQSLPAAITRERELLGSLEQIADAVIDTSDSNIHELRGQIWKHVTRGRDNAMTLVLESFAFKRGVPRDVDFVFDVRCLPNPYWEPALRDHNGLAQPVREWLGEQEVVQHMLQDIEAFLGRWLPQFTASQRSYVTVGMGCTGGKHRSVFLVDTLQQRLAGLDLPITVYHREIQQ